MLVIKLADRLHNARTWGFRRVRLRHAEGEGDARDLRPLAHRLGIQMIKLELEDLSFAVLHPKLYVEIDSLVKERSRSASSSSRT